MKKHFLAAFSMLLSVFVSAQGEAPVTAPAAADFMGGNLKIYVAVSVLTIILVLIFVFLFSMEKRLKELEGKQS